jgi:hypothetical protein
MRDQLLVEQGETYRVVPGRPLYFYKFKAKDGTEYSDRLEATPGNGLGF